MDLRGYLKVLQRRWISILVITLATVAVAAGATFALTPQYTASTRLFFGVQGATSGSDLAQGSTFAENQLVSYSQVATAPLVLDPVIARGTGIKGQFRLLAAITRYGERRRMRRERIESVGWVPWTGLFLVFSVIGVTLLALSVPGLLKGQ